jgi:hypothetical protein
MPWPGGAVGDSGMRKGSGIPPWDSPPGAAAGGLRKAPGRRRWGLHRAGETRHAHHRGKRRAPSGHSDHNRLQQKDLRWMNSNGEAGFGGANRLDLGHECATFPETCHTPHATARAESANRRCPGSVPLTPAVEQVDGFQDRASGGANGLLPRVAETIDRSASLPQKTRMAPLPHSTFHPVPESPRDRASSTAAPCLRSPESPSPNSERRGNGTRKLC